MTETITALPVEDVHANPKHYREVRDAAVKRLAASIAVVGQLEPITVRRDDNIYWVESGHHRLAALKSLGVETVDAIVLDDLDEKAAASLMVAANLHEPETELERSRGAQLMLTTGVRPLEAAAHMGVDKDRMSKVARGLAIAKDYAEDMTMDRLEVLQDLEGDAEATEKLLRAAEKDWKRVYDDAMRKHRMADAISIAEKIIQSLGVKLIKQTRTDEHHYLGRCTADPSATIEKPAGAKWATIYADGWGKYASITWYGEPVEDPKEIEKAAAREAEDAAKADREAAASGRVAWVVEYLNSTAPLSLSNALRDLAVALWEDGWESNASEIEDAPWSAVAGFTPRVYASLLAAVEGGMDTLSRFRQDYYLAQYGDAVSRYFSALVECGFEPTPAEQKFGDEIRGWLVEHKTDEEADE